MAQNCLMCEVALATSTRYGVPVCRGCADDASGATGASDEDSARGVGHVADLAAAGRRVDHSTVVASFGWPHVLTIEEADRLGVELLEQLTCKRELEEWQRALALLGEEDDLTDDPSELELGHDHTLRFVRWSPDRTLNPQFAHLPDVERYGAIVAHPLLDGGTCEGGWITFAGHVQRELDPTKPTWTVVTWEPLTLEPSIRCQCGDHGFIREGHWVPA